MIDSPIRTKVKRTNNIMHLITVKPWILSIARTVLPLLLWLCLVKGQESGVQNVTATINISYNPGTRRIIFDQSGFVKLPVGSPIQLSATGSFLGFLLFDGNSLGVIEVPEYDAYEIAFARKNADTSCISTSSTINYEFTPCIPTLLVNTGTSSSAAFLFVPRGYQSENLLDGGPGATLMEFNSLPEAGFVEGASCFIE